MNKYCTFYIYQTRRAYNWSTPRLTIAYEELLKQKASIKNQKGGTAGGRDARKKGWQDVLGVYTSLFTSTFILITHNMCQFAHILLGVEGGCTHGGGKGCANGRCVRTWTRKWM